MLDRRCSSLEQIGYVHWHLSYWNIVKLFDVTQCSPFLIGDKIDGDTSATESTAPADAETGSVAKDNSFPDGYYVVEIIDRVQFEILSMANQFIE
jgi:hypothetical protein